MYKDANKQTYDVDEVTTCIKPTTYNRALVWATQEEFQNGQFTVPNPQPSDGLRACSMEMVGIAGAALTAMNHAVVPDPTAADTPSSSDLIEEFGKATFIFASTHGDPHMIRAPKDDWMVFAGPGNTPPSQSQVGAATRNRNGIPGINFVAMYACQTMNHTLGSNFLPGNAFGVTEMTLGFLDATKGRGYLGTASRIYPGTGQYPSGDWRNPLKEHVRLFFDGLKAGDTYMNAATKANNFKEGYTRSSRGGLCTLKLLYRGDNDARIIGVYLTEAEDHALPLLNKGGWSAWFK